MAPKLTLELIAQTMVNQAAHACRSAGCGCEGRLGYNGRCVRCQDCPLDQVDTLTEALWASQPASVETDS